MNPNNEDQANKEAMERLQPRSQRGRTRFLSLREIHLMQQHGMANESHDNQNNRPPSNNHGVWDSQATGGSSRDPTPSNTVIGGNSIDS
jgi:hypothetical protein